MEGKLVVKEIFGLKKTGSITGNIGCEKIFIEEGGVFNGSCKIIDEQTFEELKVKFSQQLFSSITDPGDDANEILFKKLGFRYTPLPVREILRQKKDRLINAGLFLL